uniref:Uncharacterized protein n=1 Tax=Fagus sylvatica TaxID=28930 RepID=A0A2N9IVL9_FAGSY
MCKVRVKSTKRVWVFGGWVFWVLRWVFVRLGLGFCRLGFLGFAGWVSVHSVVVVDGLGLGLGSRRGGWKRVWVFGGGAVGLGLEVIRWLGLLAWWWLGFLLIFLLKHGVVVIRWLGLPAWWWLGFLLIFGLGLGFVGWVFWVLPVGFRCTAWWWLTAWAWAWVHGVVVGNGFGFLVVEPWVSAWRWWSRAGSGDGNGADRDRIMGDPTPPRTVPINTRPRPAPVVGATYHAPFPNRPAPHCSAPPRKSGFSALTRPDPA